MLRYKLGLMVVDRILDYMYLIFSGVGLDVCLILVGDRVYFDNDIGYFDMIG